MNRLQIQEVVISNSFRWQSQCTISNSTVWTAPFIREPEDRIVPHMTAASSRKSLSPISCQPLPKPRVPPFVITKIYILSFVFLWVLTGSYQKIYLCTPHTIYFPGPIHCYVFPFFMFVFFLKVPISPRFFSARAYPTIRFSYSPGVSFNLFVCFL